MPSNNNDHLRDLLSLCAEIISKYNKELSHVEDSDLQLWDNFIDRVDGLTHALNDPKRCPKCGSNDWDHANVGLIGAIVCTDCGEIYMMKDETTMTESEFESKFDNGDFDCEFAMFISEKYDAWAKHQMLSLWEDPDVYVAFMETKVKPSTLLQDTYFGGANPLDSFPTIRGDSK